MKNFFKKFLSVVLIILILLPNAAPIYAEGQSNVDIIVEKNTVTIKGNAEKPFDDVTLQIIRTEDGKRVYIDQLKTDESGYFSTLANLDKGKYSLTAVFSHNRVEKGFETTGEDGSGDNDEENNGREDDDRDDDSRDDDKGSSGGSGSRSRGSSSIKSSKDVEKSDSTISVEEETPKIIFTDIENYPWAKEAIEVMTAEEIMLEVSENQFAPQVNITRGDFVGALIRTLGLTTQSSESFVDISVTDPYYEDIKTAKLLGIAKGVGENRFAPNEFITRQDMMVLIYRTLKIIGKIDEKEADIKLLEQFEDKDLISDYAVEAVAKMVEMEFIKGDRINIRPKGNTTRAEAAVVLYRIYSEYNIKQ